MLHPYLSACSNDTLSATTDFPTTSIDGFKPAYIDTARNALAIDASLYKKEFAAASTTFSGTSGVYDLQLNTLAELDGESHYRISINNVLLTNTHINPIIFNVADPTDYTPASHTWTNINLTEGDDIRIEFSSETNGQIPEGDSTAYSRGRWTSLELLCKSTNEQTACIMGNPCNDNDPCTTGETFDAECNCQGGIIQDADEDGVCAAEDCDDNNNLVPATAGSSCDDGDTQTINDVIQSDGCTCNGDQQMEMPIEDPCALTIITGEGGKISIEGLDNGTIVALNIFDKNWQPVYSCWDNKCNKSGEVIETGVGSFNVTINHFTSTYSVICRIREQVEVTDIAATDPCLEKGGDADQDGICMEDDCNDEDPLLPIAPGIPCNPCESTSIQVGEGTISIAGLDSGPIAALHVFDKNWGIVYRCWNDKCNKIEELISTGNGTFIVLINYYTPTFGILCQIRETIVVGTGDECASKGGDTDRDGICSDEDCDDNDPAQPISPTATCDPCVTTSITVGADDITIEGLDNAPVVAVSVFTTSWTKVYQCWDDKCNKPKEVIPTGEGGFFVYIDYFTENFQRICKLKDTIHVGGSNRLLPSIKEELLPVYFQHQALEAYAGITPNDRLRQQMLLPEYSTEEEIFQVPSPTYSSSEIEPHFEIFPNLAQSQVSINCNLKKGEVYNLVVMDHLSRVIHQQSFIGEAGNRMVDINSSNWKAGIYYLLIENASYIDAKQLVVIK